MQHFAMSFVRIINYSTITHYLITVDHRCHACHLLYYRTKNVSDARDCLPLTPPHT